MVASGACRQGWPCLVTRAGAGRGPGKGGQWVLVFAELSPSKTLQPLDKYDLIPPEGSRMQADTSPELDPPTPFYRREHQVTGEKKARGHRGSGPRTRPGCLPSRVWSPAGDPKQPRVGQTVGKLLGQTGWIGPRLCHSPLCALGHSISFSGPQFLPLTKGLAASSWQGWGVLGDL